MKKILILAGSMLAVVLSFSPAKAWNGMDADTGHEVEIEKGSLVRPGEEIEVYNYETGQYQYVEVDGIRRSGGSVKVEVYDYDSGEYRTLMMDE